ncbi:MAG TPA: hypothetical protein VK586_07190 [Streptosporangiaceae bacterium]|nr:hypothetical protein [Streptosporangiaceae bacterium]
MELTEITALDKTLRDGRHLEIRLVPCEDAPGGYWMQASINGAVMQSAARFHATVQRNASRAVGLPHIIIVQFEVPDPAASDVMRFKHLPVGLTDAQADGIDAAKREWAERPARAALEAAPAAPTRVIPLLPFRPVPGTMMMTADGPAMILGQAGRMWTEDGSSMHLDREEGYVYDARVRDLTDAEQAEWDALHHDATAGQVQVTEGPGMDYRNADGSIAETAGQVQVTEGPGGMRVISGPAELAEPALRYLLDGGTTPEERS